MSDMLVRPPRLVRQQQLDALFGSDLSPLAGLQVGVSTSSFQTEGGLDGPGEPETHWRAWQDLARIERIDAACDLWKRFAQAASRARGMGLDLFRMSLEWARLAPTHEGLDARAVEAYADRFALLRAADIEPVVTLQHFTHPAWLGLDFWLDDRSPEIFARYARSATRQLGEALRRRGQRPVQRWLSINEPNMLALGTYLAGIFPHEKGAAAHGDPLGVPRALRAMDHMMAAHALAYRAIHEVYAAAAWPTCQVSWNLNVVDVYSLSRLMFDLLRAPSLEVPSASLAPYVQRCRDEFYDGLCAHETSSRTDAARAVERLVCHVVEPQLFEATLRTIYAKRGQKTVDFLGVDVYDPWTVQQARGVDALLAGVVAGESLMALAAKFTTGLRIAEPWEWVYEPDVMSRALRAMHTPHAPMAIDVVENGMAEHRPLGDRIGARPDGISRPEFIRGYTFAVAYARVVHNVPVRSYCHWTLVDNYELGRYAPRFGLYGLPDPPNRSMAAPWSERDAGGNDAAQTLEGFARAISLGRTDVTAMTHALAQYWGASSPTLHP